MQLSLFTTVYICVLLLIIGTVMGSFMYCAALRILSGEKISRGRSHCFSCNHVLGPLDLVPLFSWIFLGGKCRYCGAKIPAKYPLSEAITAFVYLAIYLRFGLSIKTLEYQVLFSLLLVISFTDLEGFLVPDRFIAAGIVARIAFIFAGQNELGYSLKDEFLKSLIGGLSVSVPVFIVVLIMERILKKDAMGGGDLKLFFMTGIYFNWMQNVLALLLACFLGIAMGLAFSKKHGTEQFPFGPAIAAGCFLSAMFGSALIVWYASLFT